MSDNSRRWPGIETASGLWFNYTDPKAEAISLSDIATSLGNTCRWRGQMQDDSPHVYYSVAEHAVKVSQLVRNIAGPDLALHALHHDSHEAYMGDVPTPLKLILGEAYEKMAFDVDCGIAAALDLDVSLFTHDVVKEADHLALRYEAWLLKPSQGAKLPGWNYPEPLEPPGHWKVGYGWMPERAHWRFLEFDRMYRHEAARDGWPDGVEAGYDKP